MKPPPSSNPAWRTCHYAELQSTNSEAMRLAVAGEHGPLWIIADHQTAGRGRAGRTWVSLPGNLHASLLVRLNCAPATAAQLSLVAGVAAFDAIAEVGTIAACSGLRLKWPNDILIGDDKAGGILIESSLDKSGDLIVVAGFGVNLVSRPEGAGQRATHLGALGVTVSPAGMLAALARNMDDRLRQWAQGAGFHHIRQAWLERSLKRGERLSVNTGTGLVAGSFAGLDEDGALMIDDGSGTTRRITHGDVSILGTTLRNTVGA